MKEKTTQYKPTKEKNMIYIIVAIAIFNFYVVIKLFKKMQYSNNWAQKELIATRAIVMQLSDKIKKLTEELNNNRS